MLRKKSVNAAIWSFFLPPVGLILGIIAYRKETDPADKAISMGAIVNSVISLIIWGFLGVVIWLFFSTGIYDDVVESLKSF